MLLQDMVNDTGGVSGKISSEKIFKVEPFCIPEGLFY